MTPRDKQVGILVELFTDRFQANTGHYPDWFWRDTVEGLVSAYLVSEGDVEFSNVGHHIANAWSSLCQHWFGQAGGTDIGFDSLADIESDETPERLESLGVLG
jgi:hypothetical protein